MEIFIPCLRDSKVKITGIHSSTNMPVSRKPVNVSNNPTTPVAATKTFCFKRVPVASSVLEEEPSDDYL